MEHWQENKLNLSFRSQETRGEKYHTRIFAFRQKATWADSQVLDPLTRRQAPAGPPRAHTIENSLSYFLFLSDDGHTSQHCWTPRPRRIGVMNHSCSSIAVVLEEREFRSSKVYSARRRQHFWRVSLLPFYSNPPCSYASEFTRAFILAPGSVGGIQGNRRYTTSLSFHQWVSRRYSG